MSAIHKMRGGRVPIEILSSDLGNGAIGGSTHTFSSVAVGSGDRRTIIVMVTAEDDGTGGVLNGCTVDGNSCNVVIEQAISATNTNMAAIYVLKLTTESGNVDIITSANQTMDDWGMSFIIVTNLRSETAIDTAGRGVESGNLITTTTLQGINGGIAVGVAARGIQGTNIFTWGSLMTERVDFNVGGSGTHQHGVGYNLLPTGRSATVETVTGGTGRGILVTATFR